MEIERQHRLLRRSGMGLMGLTDEERLIIANELALVKRKYPELANWTVWGKIEPSDGLFGSSFESGGMEAKEEDTEATAVTQKTLGATEEDAVLYIVFGEQLSVPGKMERVYFISASTDYALQPLISWKEDQAVIKPGCEKVYAWIQEVGAVASVVPKGTLILNEKNLLVKNVYYSGMDKMAALSLSNYQQHREYDLNKAQEVARHTGNGPVKRNLLKSLDETTTAPRTAWALKWNQNKKIVVLQSLIYIGYTFVHEIDTGAFTSIYVGACSKNNSSVLV